MMIFAFPFLILIAITLVYAEEYLKPVNYYIYWTLCMALIIFSASRPIGFDPDSITYEMTFLGNPDTLEFSEPSYTFLINFVHLFSYDVHALFLIYAAIGITIKFYAISKLSPFFYLPLAIYFGNYYILHDYIQMRASIASAFLLLSLIPLSQGKKSLGALCFLGATFFHYSAIILFVILFFDNAPLSKMWRTILLSIIPVGVVLFFLRIDFVSILPIEFIQEKAEMYQQLVNKGFFEETSLKSPFIWTKAAALYYILYYYDRIAERCPYLPLLLKITGLSLLSFFAFSSVSVIAGRISELFGIVEILLFPCVCYTFKPDWAGKAIVCLAGIIELVFTLYIWKLLDFEYIS